MKSICKVALGTFVSTQKSTHNTNTYLRFNAVTDKFFLFENSLCNYSNTFWQVTPIVVEEGQATGCCRVRSKLLGNRLGKTG